MQEDELDASTGSEQLLSHVSCYVARFFYMNETIQIGLVYKITVRELYSPKYQQKNCKIFKYIFNQKDAPNVVYLSQLFLFHNFQSSQQTTQNTLHF